VRPALRAILAAREPLPVEILQRLFHWQDEELSGFTQAIATLFPVSIGGGIKVIAPYHKSITDWLTDETRAMAYFVSEAEGHRMLADHGWNEYEASHDCPDRISEYFAKHLSFHLQSVHEDAKAAALVNDLQYLIVRYRKGKDSASFQDDFYKYRPQRVDYMISNSPGSFRILMALVPANIMSSMPANDLARILKKVRWDFQASSYSDDDMYCWAESPFDGKYYVFAAYLDWVSRPAYVFDYRPEEI